MSAWLRAAAAPLLACGLLACGQDVAPEASLPPVVVHTVAARDLDERIEASGKLVARNHARVAAEVGGRITEIVRDEGASVAEGEAVLTIDPERRRLERDDAAARMAETTAALAEAEREHGRIRALFDKGVASQARLDETDTQLRLARSRRDAARAQLGVAERALADASVRAPFAGVVAVRHISAGEFVQPGTTLFELVAMDPIDVEFHLPEVEASRVAAGQEVAVRVAPYPEEIFTAPVTFVAPTVDPDTHTLLVRAALENADHRLRSGLFARVDLGVARRRGVTMLPEEAVLQRADGEIVFRLGTGNRVERLAIDTGIHRDGEVEVRSGLSPGDRVVVRGHYALVDGVAVDPRTPDGRPAADLAESGMPPVATP